MSDVPTDSNIGAQKINQPRMSDLASGASIVPPGMGELNYIQTVLAGVIDQTLYTSSSPTFVGLILSGLSASLPVVTDGSKNLASLAYATFKTNLALVQADITGLKTTDSPTFAGATIGSLAGILKAAAGVVAAATIGTSLSYSAPTLNTIQGIRTADTPQFTGLLLNAAGGPATTLQNSTSITTANTLVGKLLFQGNAGGTQREFASLYAYSDAAAGAGDAPGRLEFYTTPDATITPTKRLVITNAGSLNVIGTASLGLANPAQTYYLRLVCGSAITADRNLTFTTGDAARNITLSGDPTLSDWFDQAVKAASTPSFAAVKLTTGPIVGKIWTCSNVDGSGDWEAPAAAMVYPGAGVPVSTGSAWGTSVTNDVSNARKFLRELSVAGVFTTPVWDTLQAADIPDISATYQPKSSNLTTYAGIAPSANAQTLLGETFAQMLSSIGAQAAAANLTTYAGIAPSANAQTLLGETFAQMLASIGAQAAAANLTTYAGIAPSANAQTLLGETFSQMKTSLAIAQADVAGLLTSSSPTFAGATIGSLAGIITGAAGVLGATALGAANLKLFMNAAGTGIEWAAGFKCVTTTHDISATGDQAITGAGFKPSSAVVLCTIDATNIITFGVIGSDCAIGAISQPRSGVPGVWQPYAQFTFWIAGTINAYFTCKSWDVDGTTITWTKTNTPTGTATIYILFLR